MKKLHLLNWAFIFSLCFFASCANNKTYHNFGGGFNVPQNANTFRHLESSLNSVNRSFNIDNESVNAGSTTGEQQQQQQHHHVEDRFLDIKNISKNKFKSQTIQSIRNLSENSNSINQSSIAKSFRTNYKSNSDKGSKVGMWIFRILGYPIAILGFLLTMVGMSDSLLGGEPLVYVGLVILALGSFMLWRAYKISKRLKNNK
jgi:hypothetical protein